MVKEITITVLPEDEKNKAFLETACFKELKKNGISADRNNTVFIFVKKSIDARHGQLKLHFR